MSTLSTNNFTELATGDTVPAKYLVHGSAKAWANLNGTGTIELRQSFGVSSVVDEGVGDYTFNLVSAFASAGYGITATASGTATSNGYVQLFNSPPTVSNFRTVSVHRDASSGGGFDSTTVSVLTHGDLA